MILIIGLGYYLLQDFELAVNVLFEQDRHESVYPINLSSTQDGSEPFLHRFCIISYPSYLQIEECSSYSITFNLAILTPCSIICASALPWEGQYLITFSSSDGQRYQNELWDFAPIRSINLSIEYGRPANIAWFRVSVLEGDYHAGIRFA